MALLRVAMVFEVGVAAGGASATTGEWLETDRHLPLAEENRLSQKERQVARVGLVTGAARSPFFIASDMEGVEIARPVTEPSGVRGLRRECDHVFMALEAESVALLRERRVELRREFALQQSGMFGCVRLVTGDAVPLGERAVEVLSSLDLCLHAGDRRSPSDLDRLIVAPETRVQLRNLEEMLVTRGVRIVAGETLSGLAALILEGRVDVRSPELTNLLLVTAEAELGERCLQVLRKI